MNVPLWRHPRALALLLTWTFAVTTWRALRMPNDFAMAHWLLDYRLGFIKRGLVGSATALVAGVTGGPPSQTAIVVAAFLLFGVSSAAVLTVLWQLASAGGSRTNALAALAFACSPFVVMHAHLTGYFDGLVVVLTVVAVASALRGRTLTGAIVLSIALLVHETALLVGLPAFVLAVSRVRGDFRRALWPPLTMFALVALGQIAQSPDTVREALTARLAPFAWLDPVIREALPRWLTDSFLVNFRQCADGLWSRSLWAVAPVLVAPTVLTALWTAWPALRARPDALLFVAVCALPQAAHLFAWDGPRLWTYSIGTAMLATWIVAATSELSVDTRWRRLPAALAIAGNIWFTIPLMDSQADHLGRPLRLLLYLPLLVGVVALMAAPGQPDRDREAISPPPA